MRYPRAAALALVLPLCLTACASKTTERIVTRIEYVRQPVSPALLDLPPLPALPATPYTDEAVAVWINNGVRAAGQCYAQMGQLRSLLTGTEPDSR